jgi:tetratricopeptide (TPR) repeat protein
VTDVASEIRRAPDFAGLARQYLTAASAWIAARPSEGARRTQVAAVVVLDLIREAFDRPQDVYRSLLPALEDACKRLRQNAPTPFEHSWFLASVALLQGAHDGNAILGGSDILHADKRLGHAYHAAEHFPDEPRFAFATILARSEVNRITREPGGLPQVRATLDAGGHVHESSVTLEVRQTIEQLSALINDRAIGSEVRLRRGVLRFELGDLTESLEDLRVAAATTHDRYVEYLAHLVSGLAWDAAGERAKALGAYQLAVQVIPDAQSAAVALAGHLSLIGRRDEAAAILERAISARTNVVDPWLLYGSGDLRNWPLYRRQLSGFLAR